MKVRILTETKALKGKPGEVVECDAKIGNTLACQGIAAVVEHDKPKGPAAKVVEQPASKKTD